MGAHGGAARPSPLTEFNGSRFWGTSRVSANLRFPAPERCQRTKSVRSCPTTVANKIRLNLPLRRHEEPATPNDARALPIEHTVHTSHAAGGAQKIRRPATFWLLPKKITLRSWTNTAYLKLGTWRKHMNDAINKQDVLAHGH